MVILELLEAVYRNKNSVKCLIIGPAKPEGILYQVVVHNVYAHVNNYGCFLLWCF